MNSPLKLLYPPSALSIRIRNALSWLFFAPIAFTPFAFTSFTLSLIILAFGYSSKSYSETNNTNTQKAAKETLYVAVASNFSKPFKELKVAFEREAPYRLITSHGSTGQLYAQIVQGAPFDVFLSADRTRPERLIQKGLADDNGSLLYARGRLALYSPQYDAEKLLKSRPLNRKTKLTIANPKLAPYGAAAMNLMQTLGLWDQWKKQVIRGQNIHQTFQFVTSGNAHLGFIAYSQAPEKKPDSTLWLPPITSYPPLWQQAVIIKRSKPQGHSNNKTGATALLTFLQSDTAKSIIQHHGYLINQEPHILKKKAEEGF